jgi:hypothetical protein
LLTLLSGEIRILDIFIFWLAKDRLGSEVQPSHPVCEKKYHYLESILIDHAHPAVRAVFLNANAPIAPPFLPRG